MKKSVIATLAAAAVATLCVPVFSGCSAELGYVLKTDENGDKYYSVAASGFTTFMKGEVTIPEYYGEGAEKYPVKEIETKAFSGTGVSKVTIPSTVEKIGNAAFSYMNSLTEVVFEGECSIQTLAWGSFAYCLNLKKIDIPSSVKVIDGMAFYGCQWLESVTLHEGLESINMGAFCDCTSLKAVVLPEGLISIGSMAFYGCNSLESIVLPDGMHSVEQPVLDDDGNQLNDEKGNPMTIAVPAVGAIAFFNCRSLKFAVLGEGISVIEGGTFGNCAALETIYIPVSVTEIKGMYATSTVMYGHTFYNDRSLAQVHYAGTEEQWQAIEIDKTVETSDSSVSDNSALLNATIHYNSTYKV